MQNNNIEDKKKLKNQEQEQEKPKFDHIANRIDFIHSLLNGKKLEPLIDVKVIQEPENVDNTIEGGTTIQHKKDIREILNKKAFDFNQIINEIGGKLKYVKSVITGHTFKSVSYN